MVNCRIAVCHIRCHIWTFVEALLFPSGRWSPLDLIVYEIEPRSPSLCELELGGKRGEWTTVILSRVISVSSVPRPLRMRTSAWGMNTDTSWGRSEVNHRLMNMVNSFRARLISSRVAGDCDALPSGEAGGLGSTRSFDEARRLCT